MPRLRTVVEAEVLEEVGYFDYLDMEMVDEGLLIRAKSPLFGKWIENITDKKVGVVASSAVAWAGGTYYIPPGTYDALGNRGVRGPEVWPPRGVQCVAFLDYSPFFSEGSPNVLWMFHTKLGEGFSLTVRQPTSPNNFEDYFQECVQAVQDIYTTCLRKASLHATFAELWERGEDEQRQ